MDAMYLRTRRAHRVLPAARSDQKGQDIEGRKEALAIIQPLPPFGHPAACADYDADCLLMTPEQHLCCFQCWETVGTCPFMD